MLLRFAARAFRTFLGAAPSEGDRAGLAHCLALLGALTALASIEVPT